MKNKEKFSSLTKLLILITVAAVPVFVFFSFSAFSETIIGKLLVSATTHIGKTLKTNPGLENGLVGHWTFDGKDMYSNIADTSGQGNDGTFFPGAVQAATLDSGADATNASGFSTGSVAPSANSLELMAISISWAGASVASAPPVTVTGNNLTWELVASQIYFPDGTGNWWNTLYLYRAMGANPSSGSVTVDLGANTFDSAAFSLVEFSNVDTSGSNGSGAVIQSAANNDTGVSAIAVTLGSFSSTGNATYGVFGAGDSDATARTFTPGTGFTELHDTGIEYASIGTQWRADNDTSVDTTASALTEGLGGIAIEIKPNATTTAPGAIGQSLKFDGLEDYVKVPSSTDFDFNYTAGFSGFMWFKKDGDCDSRETNNNEVFLSRFGASDADNTWWFGCFGIGDSDANKLIIDIEDLGAGGYVEGVTAINDAQWHYAGWTYDSGAGTLNLYLDGSLENSTTTISSFYLSSSNPLCIGNYNVDCGVTADNYDYKGSLDDVRLYNRALSADEIKRLYQMGATTHIAKTLKTNPGLENGLVGHWTFDGKDMYSNIADTSGQGNDGSLQLGVSGNISTTTAPGAIGQSLKFDGVDDYVDIGDVTTFDNLTQMTISAWVKQDSLTDDDVLIGKIVNSPLWDGFLLFRDDVGGASGRTDTYKFEVDYQSNNSSIEGATNASQQGVWTHVVGTFAGNSSTGLRLYINGVEDANSPVSTVGTLNTSSNSDLVRIGNSNAFAGKEFNGAIDDVRIYNRVLSADEIKRLYQMGR